MEYEAHFANVADFLVELVTFIEGAPLGENGALLPLGTALNVNYPPLAPDEIAGISFNVQGRTYPGLTVAYLRNADEPNTFDPDYPDPARKKNFLMQTRRLSEPGTLPLFRLRRTTP